MKLDLNPHVARHIPSIHGGPFSIDLEIGLPIAKNKIEIIDYSSNINPLGIPSSIKKTIKNVVMKTIDTYPDPDSIKLRKKLAKYVKMPFSQITVGNGATELIYNFCHAFLSNNKDNKRVLIHTPTFSEYEAASKLVGAKVLYYKTMNLNDDMDDFMDLIPKKSCVFICNPNNPTGTIIPKKNMERLVNVINKKKSILFVDECFIELATTPVNESIIQLVNKFDNLFVLRSLTKSFGLAGIRIGYGIASKQMISILNKIKIPWNVSGLAQQTAITALDNSSSYLHRSKKLIKTESNFLIKEISKIDGFECYNTETNFILIKTKNITSKELQNRLLQNKKEKERKAVITKKNNVNKTVFLIRDCSSFRGLNDTFIRIAVKTRNENKQLIEALMHI